MGTFYHTPPYLNDICRFVKITHACVDYHARAHASVTALVLAVLLCRLFQESHSTHMRVKFSHIDFAGSATDPPESNESCVPQFAWPLDADLQPLRQVVSDDILTVAWPRCLLDCTQVSQQNMLFAEASHFGLLACSKPWMFFRKQGT